MSVTASRIVFPQLVKTHDPSEDVVPDEGETPRFQFHITVGGVSIDDDTLVIQDALDTENKLRDCDFADLWKISTDGAHAPRAYGSDKFGDAAGTPVTIGAYDISGDTARFTLSGLDDNRDFYHLVYWIEPVDADALNTLRTTAMAGTASDDSGNIDGKISFSSEVTVDGNSELTSNSVEYAYIYNPVRKRIVEIDGNWVSYEVVINPDKLALNENRELTGNYTDEADYADLNRYRVTDTFGNVASLTDSNAQNNQSVDYSTIEISLDGQKDTGKKVSYDYSGSTGTFMVPDETAVAITFKTRIVVDDYAAIYNDAAIMTRNDNSFVALFQKRVTETVKVYPGSSDIMENTGEYYVRLYKYAENHMETGLPGAKFRLLDNNRKPLTYLRGNQLGQEIIFTTDENGYARIELDRSQTGLTIERNTLYYLEEIEPLVAGDTYYQKDNTLYSFIITDSPTYDIGNLYRYFNGDILKVRNYPESAGIQISKRFTGNVDLTETEQQKTSFRLVKDDGNGDWTEIERINYKASSWGDPFYYGYYTFNNNLVDVTDGNLPVGTYRILESSAPTVQDGVMVRTTWSVNCAADVSYSILDDTALKGVEFTVTAENSGRCINILCTNEYIENKLTIKKVDAQTGEALGGAEFTAYSASGEKITTYTTYDVEGDTKGYTSIAFDEQYYRTGVLYYAVETGAPARHILPENPEKIYFYFSSSDAPGVPSGLPAGETAVDLSASFAEVTVENRQLMMEVPVVKSWDLGTNHDWRWPEQVAEVKIGLYRSINGSVATAVTDDSGEPLTLILKKDRPFDRDTFTNLPAEDGVGNKIQYSIRELAVTDADGTDITANYAPSYAETNAGIYAVKNRDGVSVKVEKEWCDKDGNPIENETILASKPDVSFDLYRSTVELSGDQPFARTELEQARTNGTLELVQAGLTLGAADDWEAVIESLEKYSSDGTEYQYYVIETESSYTDGYQVTQATADDLRTLTIRNTGMEQRVCKIGSETFYTLSAAMQYAIDYDMVTPVIEMLRDYIIPVTDAVEIPRGFTVTLTTASTDVEVTELPFNSGDDSGRTTAVITRYETFLDRPVITNQGTLNLKNIVLDGGNVKAAREMIYTEGALNVGVEETDPGTNETRIIGATIQNAVNSGNGGAIYAKSGQITVLGGSAATGEAIYHCSADTGAAIYMEDGAISISGGKVSGNTAVDSGGAIYYGGTGTVTVSGGEVSHNSAQYGSGGGILAEGGTVAVSGGEVSHNRAQNGSGGGVYSRSAVVNVEENAALSNNRAKMGGALYADSGSVFVNDGTISGNISTGGGGIYINSGSVYIKGGSLTNNWACTFGQDDEPDFNQDGGAVYAFSGTVHLSGGSLTGNQARNGAALFISSGTANLSGGEICDNTAHTAGGAVGVGATTARLYFRETICVTGNWIYKTESDTGVASNVYLNQDSNEIINAVELKKDSRIGVYVPDSVNRGIPGTTFASYTGKDVNKTNDKDQYLDISEMSYAGIFTNDRSSGMTAIVDISVKRILWGKAIPVQVRYVSSYAEWKNNQMVAAFPPVKDHSALVGDKKYPGTGDYFDFYPASSDTAMSDLADNLRNRYSTNVKTTAVYGHAFNMDVEIEGEDAPWKSVTFADYLTWLKWDTGENKWVVKKRDNTTEDCDKLVIFFTEPSYISIENNTDLPTDFALESQEGHKLNISELTVLGRSAMNDVYGVSPDVAGYGYVTAKNGETEPYLRPVTAADLQNIQPGGSIKILFPGGYFKQSNTVRSAYQLYGRFDGTSTDPDIDVYRTGSQAGTYEQTTVSATAPFELNGNTNDSTYEIIFGRPKPVCKIVTATVSDDPSEDETAGYVAGEEGGTTEYLFKSISQALLFMKNHNIRVYKVDTDTDEVKYVFSTQAQAQAQALEFQSTNAKYSGPTAVPGAVIEMLVDYLLPNTDGISVPAGYDVTFTTAVSGSRRYSTNPGARAAISRDSGNSNTLFQAPDGQGKTMITMKNLRFDGKNLAGNIDGGVLRTKDAQVLVENTDFVNCVANNGGGMYIDYTNKRGNDYCYSYPKTAILTVKNSTFTGCASKSTQNRVGGGAIWTTARLMILDGCTFTQCSSIDQGGAVFHRVDAYFTDVDTTSRLTNCTFEDCEARAAGGFETDATIVYMNGCRFTRCNASQRNGGAMNVYSNNSSSSDNPCVVTVEDTTFYDCHAETETGEVYGGGLRSAAKETYVRGCSFNNVSALNGGAIACSNNFATKTEILGCTIDNATAISRGGGIYTKATDLEVGDYKGKATSLNNCTARTSDGGGINHDSSSAVSAVLTNCGIYGASAEKNGGGISTGALQVTLTNCQIRNNTARTGNGGGIYRKEVNNSSLVLEKCSVTGNTAGNYGGGVFAGSTTTMIETTVTGNRLTGTNKALAAGVYMSQKQLVLGQEGQIKDGTTITDNYTADGGRSNLRLHFDNGGYNNVSSVLVNCDLAGKIYVVNAARKGDQFGSSTKESPAGFADLDHVFTADDGSLFGIVDRSDTNHKKLIWAGDPICKITDSSGNMLFFDAENKKPAIFDRLDKMKTNDSTSAFGTLRMQTPGLYDRNGKLYEDNAYCIKLLVEEYTTADYLTTATGLPGRTITLTTAGTTDIDGYPYTGKEGTAATIYRGVGNGNLLTARVNMNLENITLDGRSGTITAVNDTRNLYVDNSAMVTLGANVTLRNAEATEDGGAVYVKSGSLILQAGSAIRSSSSINGGAVYNAGTLTMKGGRISGCTASGNGGGVYNNGIFTMTGGEITGCTADVGGGAFVAAGKTMTLSDGRIQTNRAATGGGGIGMANSGSIPTITFSGSANVSRNTLTSGEDCNVQLDQDSNYIIRAGNLTDEAYIGVYVPGERSSTADGYAGGLYGKHGDAEKPFGQYEGSTENLRRFVNDINNLRGGTNSAAPGDNHFIYWMKIYFLEVKKQVLSDNPEDMNRIYYFDVELTGTGTDREGKLIDASNITTPDNDPDLYGEIQFKNGIAENVAVQVVNGEGSVLAENLPGGLEYTVTERLDTLPGDKRTYFTTLLNRDTENNPVTSGTIGSVSDGVVRYQSTAEFVNIRAICKLTSQDGSNVDDRSLLYYLGADKQYAPAVYTKLASGPSERSAFSAIRSTKLYYYSDSEGKYKEYEGNYNIEMLIPDYTMTTSATLNVGKKVTIRTADINAAQYPYAGDESNYPAMIRRGSGVNSMLTVTTGELILEHVTLDGNNYACQGNGGIVKVGSPSGTAEEAPKLTVKEGATLRNSSVTQLENTVYSGGAVYLYPYGAMTMTGGAITGNSANGAGAGVYLSEGAKLNLSGSPDFGGADVDANGNIEGTSGNFKLEALSGGLTNGGVSYARARQDVFIAGYEGADGTANAASLVVNGAIDSGEGSIWVWAAGSPHYKTLEQFAVLGENLFKTEKNKATLAITDDQLENSLKAFRNARPDKEKIGDADVETGAEQTGHYLYGVKSEKGGVTEDRNVYWSGVEGSAHVMLVKVLESNDGNYQALSDRTFTVYTNSSMGEGSEAKGTYHDSNAETEVVLKNLSSGAGGAFFIGELAYGDYYVKEWNGGTEVGSFKITIHDGGVVEIVDPAANPKTTKPVKFVELTHANSTQN